MGCVLGPRWAPVTPGFALRPATLTLVRPLAAAFQPIQHVEWEITLLGCSPQRTTAREKQLEGMKVDSGNIQKGSGMTVCGFSQRPSLPTNGISSCFPLLNGECRLQPVLSGTVDDFQPKSCSKNIKTPTKLPQTVVTYTVICLVHLLTKLLASGAYHTKLNSRSINVI